ncbi:MAG: hypothetical protein K2M90_02655 [Treponemataceae bacterium]|nr:hypothetical protein [Treponemataceae bacterium]MDE7141225.1 hypothetical protein [Treponemataceae bacterium]MDE7391351.1 hypothetical protein [Treponemataceae bacterium]
MMNVSVTMENETKEDPFYSAENQERLALSVRHAQEGLLTEHELIEA